MAITLTRADERRLTDAASALVTPLDHATFEAWAERVYRRVKAVVGADTGGLKLPSAERHHFVAPEGEPGVIAAYREIWPLYAKRFRLAQRAVELGVHNRAMLYHPYGEEMFNGPYYHDFVVPYRCFDAICMSTGPTRDGFWAGVLLHHESAKGPRFGERGLALFRLLHLDLFFGCGPARERVNREWSHNSAPRASSGHRPRHDGCPSGTRPGTPASRKNP